MKKLGFVAAAVAAAVALGSCASTPPAAATEDAPHRDANVATARSVKREAIDWKGAGVGAEIPDWIIAAAEEDVDALPARMRDQLNGKHYIIISTERVRKDPGSTKDLKLAQEAAAANYMVNIARSLNSAADTRFSGALSASEDSQRTLTATASSARFTGFSRVADGWVLLRITDSVTKKTTDTYTVVQIYACDQELWEAQAASYYRQFGVENPESDDMRKAAEMADELAASVKSGRITDVQ